MKKTTRRIAALLALLMTFTGVPATAFAATSGDGAIYDSVIESELSDYLLYQTTFSDELYVGATAKVSVYYESGELPAEMCDPVIYVKNRNGERIGTKSDVDILTELITGAPFTETGRKAIVIVLDYGYSGGSYAQKSVPGTIERSLGAYRDTYLKSNTLSLGTLGNASVSYNHIYYLPEGYTIERDILFWESDIHSGKGTLTSVMNAWNNHLANSESKYCKNVYYDYYVEGDVIPEWEADGTTVGSPKHDENGNVIAYPDGHIAPKVSRVEDCVKSDGSPMDYSVRLDIIHPAFADGDTVTETPVAMIAATESPRMAAPTITGTQEFFGAYVFNGYTGVVYDYAYVPMARGDHYSYISAYGTHGQNAAKWARAAVRCVRYYAEEFGYSDQYIGVMGLSKGTPTAAALSVKNNEDLPEQSPYATALDENKNEIYFEGGTNVYQPYSTYAGGYDGNGGVPQGNPTATNTKTGAVDSNVTVAYVSAGDGQNWRYQDGNYTTYAKANGGYVPGVIACGRSDPYGCWDHWDDILAYMADNATEPYLAISMEDQGHVYPTGVDPIRGYDRYPAFVKFFDSYLKPDSYAPTTAYISPMDGATDVAITSTVEVQLLAKTKIDLEQIKANLTVKDSNGNTVEGQWTTTAAGTSNLFTFTPSKGLLAATKYVVTVSDALKDENGVSFDKTTASSFTTEGIKSFGLIEDTYVSEAEPDTSFVWARTLEISPANGQVKIPMFTFDRSLLAVSGDLSLVIPNMSETVKDVDIVVVDGYAVSADTTYNSVKALLSASSIMSTVTLDSGIARLNVNELFRYVRSEEFTIALVPRLPENFHTFSQSFDTAPIGFNSALANTDDVLANEGVSLDAFKYQTYSKFYDYTVGYNAQPGDITVANDSERGNVGMITRRNGRYRFYNSFEDRELTAADVGRTFEVTFYAKAVKGTTATEESTYIRYGRMQPNSTTNPGYTATLTDSWQKITFPVTLASSDLTTTDNIANHYALFAIVTPATSGFTYYIDDISIVEIVPSASMTAKDANAISATLISYAELDTRDPLSDAYVSKLFPDNNYGDAQALKVSGGEGTAISLVSFRTDSLLSSEYIGVNIPVNNATIANVKVSYIPDLYVDESSVTYNSIADKLATAIEIGQYKLNKGIVHVSLQNIKDALKQESVFTLVIESVDTYDTMLNHDFEEFTKGDTLAAAGSPLLSYNTVNEYIGVRGYNGFQPSDGKALLINEEANGNKYATVKAAASGASRLGIYNGFGYNELTSADVGKTFTLTARVRLSEGCSTATLKYAPRNWTANGWTTSAQSIVLTDREWHTVSMSYTIAAGDVPTTEGEASPTWQLFTFEFVGGGIVDIDDIAISQSFYDGTVRAYGASIASRESTRKNCVSLVDDNVGHEDQVLADTYVDQDNPYSSYGSDVSIKLRGEEGKNILSLSTFASAILENTNYLKLPSEGIADGQVVSIAVLDGYYVDETNLSYNDVSAVIRDAKFVGRFTLSKNAPYIDVSNIKDLVSGGIFTLVIQSDQAHSYSEDFEGTKSLIGAPSPDGNFSYGSSYIARTGSWRGSHSKAAVADASGAQTNVLQVTGGGMRYKFYNSLSYDEVTPLDMGRRYKVSFDFKTNNESFTGFVSLKSSTDAGNGSYLGASIENTVLASNDYIGAYSFTPAVGEWENYSYEIYLDPTTKITLPSSKVTTTAGEAAWRYQASMLTFETTYTGNSSIYYCFDNITVTEIGGNESVLTSAFNSKESGKETMSFVSFTASEATLENVTVLETSVSLSEASEETSDIFFVLGNSAYSLLTLDHTDGKLGFTKDGTFYTLCNSKGVEYVVTDSELPVAVIYDSASGVARFAVDGRLAYYTDGTDCKNSYGTVLVDGRDSGNVKVGLMTTSSAVSTAAIHATSVKSELPEIIGTQAHVYDHSVRMVSGIDMLYYSQIGFIVSYNETSIEKVDTLVYSSIEADGETIAASELGCKYITTLVITDLDSAPEITEKIFTVTPVAYIDDVKLMGGSVTYSATISNGQLTLQKVTE